MSTPDQSPGHTGPRRVLVTGAFRFPRGDAGGGRVLNLGKALREADWEVLFAGLPSDDGAEASGGGPRQFQGFAYEPFPDAGSPAAGPGSTLSRYLRSGEQTLAALGRGDFGEVRAVVAYGGTAPFLARLRRLCRARGVAVVCDCVEWHDPAHRPGGRVGAVHLDDCLRMHLLLPRMDGVIGISTYLGHHYAGKSCPTVVLPPVIDARDPEWPAPAPRGFPPGPLRLAFTGSPDRERWDLILGALDRLEAAGIPAVIHLFGGAEAQLVAALGPARGRWPDWRRHVAFRGRLGRGEYLEAVAACDASFLLREDARWSRACFPSKVPELLRLGLPLLFNDTSDLGRYLEDGREGYRVEALSEGAFAGAVARLARATGEERLGLRDAALACASGPLDYRAWVAPLDRFVRSLGREGVA